MGEKKFKIFPILCNSFYELIQQGISPLEDPIYHRTINLLEQQFTQFDKICFVASADLAHIGPQFGHREAITPGTLAETRAKDLEMLGHVQELEAEEFYRFVLQEKDRRNICGLPPIYALVNLIKAQTGHLLNYQQWQDPQGKAAVTFASLAFTE